MPNPQNDRNARPSDFAADAPIAPREIIEPAYTGEDGNGGAAFLPIADLLAAAQAEERAEAAKKVAATPDASATSSENPLGSAFIREPRADLESLTCGSKNSELLPIDYPEFLEDGAE